MTSEKFNQTVNLLTSSSKFCIKLGIERIKAVLEILGNPQKNLKIIHIAGTNGKGSVCTVLAEILKNSGFKTGLYTSPHLYSYTERFKINNIPVTEDKLSEYVSFAENISQKNGIELTEFEILTVAAFLWFRDEKTDFAVLETGLGGRFDATNVIDNPVLSVITSISEDHKDRLGDTVEKIAFEKAGIIKKSPVVISDKNRGYQVVKNTAEEQNSKLLTAGEDVSVSFENGINYVIFGGKKYEYGIWGLKQAENIKLIAETVRYLESIGVKIPEHAFVSALKNVFIPARMQYIKEKNILLDGAHNADAAKGLKENIGFYFPNVRKGWVYGSLSTKEYGKNVNILFDEGDEVLLYKFDHKLSVSPSEILAKINNSQKLKFIKSEKSANMLNNFSPDRLIIFAGSFYMLGQMPYLSE